MDSLSLDSVLLSNAHLEGHTWPRWKVLVLGQVVSVLYFGAAVLAANLQVEQDVAAPNFTAWSIYIFLCLFLIPLYQSRSCRQFRRKNSSNKNSNDRKTIFSEQPPEAKSKETKKENISENVEKDIKGKNNGEDVLTPSSPKEQSIERNSPEPVEELSEQRPEQPPPAQATNPYPYTFLNIIPLHSSWKSYLVIGFVDYIAIWTQIYSLNFTTLTSFISIYSLQTPFVMLFSKCIVLRRRYHIRHWLGVILCIVGVSVSVWKDGAAETDHEEDLPSTTDKVYGNLLVLLSTIFYALLDILCEIVLDNSVTKHNDSGTVEYLAMSGFFGAVCSIGPTLLFERSEIQELFSEDRTALVILAALILTDSTGNYFSCKFLEVSEAALLNISTLSLNFMSVLYAVAVEERFPVILFYVGVVMTVTGLAIYETAGTPKPIYDEAHEEENSSSQKGRLSQVEEGDDENGSTGSDVENQVEEDGIATCDGGTQTDTPATNDVNIVIGSMISTGNGFEAFVMGFLTGNCFSAKTAEVGNSTHTGRG